MNLSQNRSNFVFYGFLYDLLYKQRSYIHWYVAEGMEEGDFDEGREDLGVLCKDYRDVLDDESSDGSYWNNSGPDDDY